MDTYIPQKEMHKRFGGLIYPTDFEPDIPTTYAARAAADLLFDERCKREAKLRDRINNDVK